MQRIPSKRIAKNKGIALIMALMVFALVSAVAASIVSQLARERSLLSQMQSTAKLKQQLLGGEVWARNYFALLTNSNAPTLADSALILTEQNFAMDDDDDSMRVVIIDRQNCYNLNRLADSDGDDDVFEQVQSLLTKVGLESDLAAQLKDWVDDDQDITDLSGHEDEYYQTLTPSFRTADSFYVDESELRLLQLEESELKLLVKNFCFRPQDIGLNVNRLSSDMLEVMMPDLSSTQLSALNAQIASAGFSSVDDFLNSESVSDLTLNESDWRANIALVDVFVDVTLSDRSMWLHTRLYKDDDGLIHTYFRAYGANVRLQKLFGIYEESDDDEEESDEE